MERLKSRFGWALAGALGIILVLTLARAIQAGPLDPPGPVGSTMRTMDELLPSWGKTLSSSGGCTSQRFTCVMSNQAVLDHETGLVWQRTPGQASDTWQTANAGCQNGLYANRLGWRLPTLSEIFTLFDSATADGLPLQHPFLSYGLGNVFWTSTTDPTDEQTVLAMFFGGAGYYESLAKLRYGQDLFAQAQTWCVRSPGGSEVLVPDEQPAWSRMLDATGGCTSARFECVLNDEAVLDHETGLVWQRTPSATQDSWSNSLSRCDERPYGGRMGWRLPQSYELASLMDASVVGPSLSLPPGHPFILGAASPIFWTTSRYGGGSGRESAFFQGSVGQPGTVSLSINSVNRYWCVRGGSGEDPQ